MQKENFFGLPINQSGEAVGGSFPMPPPITDEQEAEQNATFGKYDYDPGVRMMSQPQPLYGQQQGIGYNPWMQPNPYQYGGPQHFQNPAFAFQQQQYQLQQQQRMQQLSSQEAQIFVPPVNFGGDYLPSMNFMDDLEKMKIEYWQKEQEQTVEQAMNNRNNGWSAYYGGTNYYGTPYVNPYQYNSLVYGINKEVERIKEEAKNSRKEFSMNLSRLAHNMSKDGISDESIEERYTGKYIPNPYFGRMTYGEIFQQNRFTNLVPFDNSGAYREHHKAVSDEYHKIIPENADMVETFLNMGVLNAQYALDEEEHRRRDMGALYNSSDGSYRRLIKQKVAERYAKEKGITLGGIISGSSNTPIPNPMTEMFPTLAQSAKLCDDGSLSITCNFGSHAGQNYTVHNSNEAEYDEKRERFKAFVNAIPQSIYKDGPKPS